MTQTAIETSNNLTVPDTSSILEAGQPNAEFTILIWHSEVLAVVQKSVPPVNQLFFH